MTDRETFLARAAEARKDADAALLDNVRDRCLRSEAAWSEMAARAERTEKMRAARDAEKAAIAALPVEALPVEGLPVEAGPMLQPESPKS